VGRDPIGAAARRSRAIREQKQSQAAAKKTRRDGEQSKACSFDPPFLPTINGREKRELTLLSSLSLNKLTTQIFLSARLLPPRLVGRRQGLGQRGRRRRHRQGHPDQGKRFFRKILSFFLIFFNFFFNFSLTLSFFSFRESSLRKTINSGTPSRTSPRPSSTPAAPSSSSGSRRPSSAPSTPSPSSPSSSSLSASGTPRGSSTATCSSSRAARSSSPTSRSSRRRSPRERFGSSCFATTTMI